MLTGIASGGPRDNVKLSAPPLWDGIVYKTTKGRSPYKGRYVWTKNKWKWETNTEDNSKRIILES